MEVSCVIPAFERLDLVTRCLTSVAAQAAVDLEILVTDDSPGPTVRDFVAAFAHDHPCVRYLEGPRTGNPVDNWNHGLDQARAAIVVLVHQDEYLIDPTYLRRAANALRRTGAAAVVAGVSVTGVTRPSRFALVGPIARRLPNPTWWLPSINWIGPTAAFVFRAGPRFDPALAQLTDVEFYGRVLGGGRPARLAEVCVGSLAHHPGQITAALDTDAVAMAELRVLAARDPPALTVWQARVARAYFQLRARLR